MPKLADRVAETTTTTGTGTVTLAGAKTGYRTFASVSTFADGDLVYYAIFGTSEWETGVGTLGSSKTTLARTVVLASSNAGSAVNFSAGAKDVICTAAAASLAPLGPYTTAANLESAYPAAANVGRFGLVGSSAPYLPYVCDGSAWVSILPAGDPYVAVASSGASQSFNIATAGILDLTLTANCTLSVTGAVSGTAYSARIILRQDGTGSRTVTWPSGTKWPYGAAPVLSTPASSIDEVVLTTFDGGTTFFGDIVAKGRA